MQLIVNNLHTATGHDPVQRINILADGRRIGKQAVQRNERCHGGKDREQGIVRDARCLSHHTIVADARIDGLH